MHLVRNQKPQHGIALEIAGAFSVTEFGAMDLVGQIKVSHLVELRPGRIQVRADGGAESSRPRLRARTPHPVTASQPGARAIRRPIRDREPVAFMNNSVVLQA
jgi:hypothetical protein